MTKRRLLGLIMLLLLVAVGSGWLFLNRTGIDYSNHVQNTRRGEVAVLFSGDVGFVGLGLGQGPDIARVIEGLGLPVYGVSSLKEFGAHRTLRQTVRIIDQAVREGMARYGADRVLLVGQSYGADVIASALPDLSADVRQALIGVVLVVPANSVYLRADPTTVSYRGPPDVISSSRAGPVNWTPMLCIYGEEEPDSLCPLLKGANQTVIASPGGHALHHDIARLRAALAQGTRGMLPDASRAGE
jgi:type IV secretory pathway VirJ component